jgi:hypothetical protein
MATVHADQHNEVNTAVLALQQTGGGYSVHNYGAVNDGVTDDGPAFQNCINAAASAGTYANCTDVTGKGFNFLTGIIVPSNADIRGFGALLLNNLPSGGSPAGGQGLFTVPGAGSTPPYNTTTYTTVSNINIEGFRINSPSATPRQAIRLMGQMTNITLRNLTITNHVNFSISVGTFGSHFNGLVIDNVSISGACGLAGIGSGIDLYTNGSAFTENTTLTNGSACPTTWTVSALPVAMPSGAVFWVQDATAATQIFSLSTAAAAGATSISVNAVTVSIATGTGYLCGYGSPASTNLRITNFTCDVTNGSANTANHGPQCLKMSNTVGVILNNLSLTGGSVCALDIVNGTQELNGTNINTYRSMYGFIVSSVNSYPVTAQSKGVALNNITYDPLDATPTPSAAARIGQVDGFTLGNFYFLNSISLQQDAAPGTPWPGFTPWVCASGRIHHGTLVTLAGGGAAGIYATNPTTAQSPMTGISFDHLALYGVAGIGSSGGFNLNATNLLLNQCQFDHIVSVNPDYNTIWLTGNDNQIDHLLTVGGNSGNHTAGAGGGIFLDQGLRNNLRDVTTLSGPNVKFFYDGGTGAANATLSGALSGTATAVTVGTAPIQFTVPVATGTAVLVAGTVTVTGLTSITATSRVRLSNQQIGGTPGALYVSAKTAGTGFTITSTSATDTSTVYWELL